MPLIEDVEEILIRHKNGKITKLTPSSVTKVPTRASGEPMSKHGSITYWHIIARDNE